MFNAVDRWRGAVLCLFLSLAVGFLTPAAWAASGRGGGDDDDDRDSSDSDGGEGGEAGSGDGGEAGDGGEGGGDEAGDGGGSGGSDDGGESSGGSDDGGDSGGSDGGGEGGQGGDDGPDNSGSGGEGGEGGKDGDDKSGPSANSGRSFDDDDLVSVSRNDAGESIREGEAIVLTGKADFAQRLPAKGFRLVESFRVETIGASALRIAVPGSMSERDALDALQRLDPKGIVTFNHVYNPAGAAPPALGAAVRSASPKKRVRSKVGLVDAAVNTKHPMLKEVVVNARSFDPAAKTLPDSHGTAVASLIAEAAPGATVFAANVFTFSTDGREIATADAIVRGLDWLAKMQVAVINLSLTGPANPILEAMIQKLTAKGHLLVAAVGNEGPRGAPQFPAAYDKVVGVTAVDAENRVYLYANHGDYVDFAAPGVDRRVANTEGSTETVSGTSYASPIVAAKLAASLDVPDAARAGQAVKALAAEAQDLGAPGRDPVFGYGLIGD